ncbi:nucleoside triphosphate pyrophosphohydrolase [Paenibacillus thalictri]|uniref:Nucleoside triphosphate pyrophosphohydrolase n=1 Tax=Paenibacillus thalictri TaxID=2527873 RepID=A0A4V2J312_9BACL|nr:nucleoside triphosphate pyrophosphohydrolase [Paenibacillus thalictri]TBL69024.1 nucleoside triphosphate pyrophosphohydrolase [Paenibacillus thalictri]
MANANGKITVVGLGSGDAEQLTLGIWKRLQAAKRLVLRTEQHPVVGWLRENGLVFTTYDHVYEQHGTFEGVYEQIAAELVAEAKTTGEEIVYAVPGHPMVAEASVQLLRQHCPQEGVELTVLGGESFLEQAFLRLGFDPVDGFQLLDGCALNRYTLNPQLHTVITQVFDTYTASDVKLTLMELYPDDYEVVVGHELGVAGAESILRIPLYELDRVEGYGNLSLVWVPKSEREHIRNRTFARLHEIVSILRSPEGCPWDREQTHASLRKNLIEEAYEVIETIEEDDPAHMCEELGDLLLQVMLHAQIEDDEGSFNVFDVIQGLNEKLLRRHPHVFGDISAQTADDALASWQAIKQEEKRQKGIDVEQQSALDGVPRELPGLMRAWKLQKKAAAVGFDWSRAEEVWVSVEQELAELKEAMAESDREHQKEELGDVLFSLVNLARFLKADPEEAIALTNRKFIQRFEYIEQQLRLKGVSFAQTDLIEMESLWQEAKKVLKNIGD